MTPSRPKIHRTATAASLLVVLSGCASLPPPTAEIGAANAAVTIASTPDGQRYAADELAAAHNDLAAAQAAIAKDDYDRARQLAAAALADADLARAKGRALAAQSAVAAKTEENATLRRQLLDQETLK
jgi:Skp family chaperone for outer membrane proteins